MKQYMLSEKNNEYVEVLNDVLEHFAVTVVRNVIKDNDRIIPRMGIFSKIIGGISFALFDNDEFLSKFPTGFVTENIVAIPLEKFKELDSRVSSVANNTDKGDIRANFDYDIAKFLFSYMKPLVEKNFNVSITKQDEDDILNIYSGQILKLSNDLLSNDPVVISNKKLSTFIKGKEFEALEQLIEVTKGFKPEKLIDSELDKDVSGFNLVEKYLKKNKVESNLISVEEFRKNCDSHFPNVDNLRFVLSKLDTLINESGQNPKKFVEKSNDLIAYSMALPDLQFKVILSDIERRVFRANKANYTEEMLDIKKDFAIKISDNKYFNMHHRKLLIEVISGTDNLATYTPKKPSM